MEEISVTTIKAFTVFVVRLMQFFFLHVICYASFPGELINCNLTHEYSDLT